MKVSSIYLTIIFLAVAFVCLIKPVLAVSVTISGTPDSISDQPFNLSVSITGASPATNYLRADFFQPDTTNYFGYTYNGTDWYNGSDPSQYLPVAITSSGYTGSIQAKIDTYSSKFKGSGAYNLRVRRYTQSGNYTSGESNIITLSVNLSSSSPTPTPTPISSPTSTPTPSSTANLSSFTVSNIPTQINSDQSFIVSVNLSSNNPNVYFKGAFKKIDGSNYFGLTKISGNWVKNSSNFANQYQGSGNFELEIKPDTEDSGYTGSSDYLFKVAGYSGTGDLTWSNEATINIQEVNAQTPQPATSSKPTSQPSSSAKPGTSYKTTPSVTYRLASIAAVTTSSPSASGNIQVKSNQQTNIFKILGTIFLLSGLIMILYLFLKSRLKSKIS